MSILKPAKVSALMVAEILSLSTFFPQFISSASAQSITDKSCVADILGEDIGSQVNIRSGAGTIFSVIGTVSVGNLAIVAIHKKRERA